MKLLCWNIKTILDKTGSNRPARGSALIAHELSRPDMILLHSVKFASQKKGVYMSKAPGITSSGLKNLQKRSVSLVLVSCSKPQSHRS